MSTSNAFCQSLSLPCAARAETLATNISTPPSPLALSATKRSSAALSATSRASPKAPTPLALRLATAAFTSSAFRAQIATLAPSSAKISAARRPIPFVPPVTMARRPFKPRSTFSSLSRRQILFQDRSAQSVFGIDHVPDAHAPGLGQQEIGFDVVEAVVGCEPANEFAIGYARRVLHWPRGADRHDEAVVLEAWPANRPPLDEIDVDGRRRRDFDRHPTKLAVALPAVAVAEEQVSALRLHGEIEGRPRRDVGQI